MFFFIDSVLTPQSEKWRERNRVIEKSVNSSGAENTIRSISNYQDAGILIRRNRDQMDDQSHG